MTKNSSHWAFTLVLGVFLLHATGCKKEEDKGVPDLTTTAVTNITQNTAKSGGKINSDGGSTITARGVCWGTGQTPTISGKKTVDGSGIGTFTSNISGLSANTTYYVRAYATNSSGTSYGNTISFTTQQGSIGNSFTDSRDGNVYKIVTIGNQVWMAENLRFLPSVVGPGTGSQTTPYYYVYGYNGTNVNEAKATSNYTNYGVLYNWVAAMNGASSSTSNPSGVKGVCPAGWHLPSNAEWSQLINFLGGETIAGGKLKAIGTVELGTGLWNSPNTGATNETGFTALPGGRRSNSGSFNDIGRFGNWWTTTSDLFESQAWYRTMSYDHTGLGALNGFKELGFCIRCIKD
jgi:uncharacterized protein (TIGR02145 family)